MHMSCKGLAKQRKVPGEVDTHLTRVGLLEGQRGGHGRRKRPHHASTPLPPLRGNGLARHPHEKPTRVNCHPFLPLTEPEPHFFVLVLLTVV